MDRVLRTFIACLLLVALPLQGYAAGMMLFCGADAAARMTALEHRHDGGQANDHHGSHDHGAPVIGADDTDQQSLHDVMHGKCSACSSCCSASALASAPIVASTATPDAGLFPAPERASPDHRPALPERPPSQLLA